MTNKWALDQESKIIRYSSQATCINCPVHFQDNCVLVINTEKPCMGSCLTPSQYSLLHTIQMYITFPLTQAQRRGFLSINLALFREVCYNTGLRMWLPLDSSLWICI